MLLDIRLLSDCLTDSGFYDFFLSLFTFLCSKLTENSDGRKNKRFHTCVNNTKNFFDNSDQPAKGESLFWGFPLGYFCISLAGFLLVFLHYAIDHAVKIIIEFYIPMGERLRHLSFGRGPSVYGII